MLGPKLWTRSQLSTQVEFYVVDHMNCSRVFSGNLLLHVADCLI
jgi:hypothetical protein